MKLPVISGKDLIKILCKEGFEIVGRKGSHTRLKKKTPEKVLVTVVPLHKKLDVGTLIAILRQCEFPREKCDPVHNPSAWITNFGWTKIVDEWEVWGGTLFKLGHTK